MWRAPDWVTKKLWKLHRTMKKKETWTTASNVLCNCSNTGFYPVCMFFFLFQHCGSQVFCPPLLCLGNTNKINIIRLAYSLADFSFRFVLLAKKPWRTTTTTKDITADERVAFGNLQTQFPKKYYYATLGQKEICFFVGLNWLVVACLVQYYFHGHRLWEQIRFFFIFKIWKYF